MAVSTSFELNPPSLSRLTMFSFLKSLLIVSSTFESLLFFANNGGKSSSGTWKISHSRASVNVPVYLNASSTCGFLKPRLISDWISLSTSAASIFCSDHSTWCRIEFSIKTRVSGFRSINTVLSQTFRGNLTWSLTTTSDRTSLGFGRLTPMEIIGFFVRSSASFFACSSFCFFSCCLRLSSTTLNGSEQYSSLALPGLLLTNAFLSASRSDHSCLWFVGSTMCKFLSEAMR
ncbi:hypothetical protein OGAPHI_005600 [Ogataea philodendri]|uniref:Uncharacterized protein n=1 Tax=Ogataea philodendri TaxID=1378263 RepID=A0A9P8NY23_9ASCO|nr:uncharacterized protein OGAPHI_005600 [Ogataea philodendri]KAH3662348.1 hypothetical protein OGAPHI_005600 [Ogataea philodendri]